MNRSNTGEYVYVAVDETGNLGKSLKSERYYILVACVVNDRKRFEDATRRLNLAEEVKFYSYPFLRRKILEYAAPAVSDVFYVRYHKKNGALNRFEQSELHLDMIRSLADVIMLRYGTAGDMTVEVDHKDGISEEKVRYAFENNEYRFGPVFCDVLDSSESYGLQTNDFFVGAIGQMLNKSDFGYVRMIGTSPKELYSHSYNTKRGEPASTIRQNTGHADIPPKTGKPPGIADRFRMRDAGCPSVRLVNNNGRNEYKNASLKSKKNLIPRRGLRADVRRPITDDSGLRAEMNSIIKALRRAQPEFECIKKSTGWYENGSRIYNRVHRRRRPAMDAAELA